MLPNLKGLSTTQRTVGTDHGAALSRLFAATDWHDHVSPRFGRAGIRQMDVGAPKMMTRAERDRLWDTQMVELERLFWKDEAPGIQRELKTELDELEKLLPSNVSAEFEDIKHVAPIMQNINTKLIHIIINTRLSAMLLRQDMQPLRDIVSRIVTSVNKFLTANPGRYGVRKDGTRDVKRTRPEGLVRADERFKHVVIKMIYTKRNLPDIDEAYWDLCKEYKRLIELEITAKTEAEEQYTPPKDDEILRLMTKEKHYLTKDELVKVNDFTDEQRKKRQATIKKAIKESVGVMALNALINMRPQPSSSSSGGQGSSSSGGGQGSSSSGGGQGSSSSGGGQGSSSSGGGQGSSSSSGGQGSSSASGGQGSSSTDGGWHRKKRELPPSWRGSKSKM